MNVESANQPSKSLLDMKNISETTLQVMRPRRSPRVSFMDENGEVFKLSADDLLEPFNE